MIIYRSGQITLTDLIQYIIAAMQESIFQKPMNHNNHQHFPNVALCLNPDCQNFSRSFVFTGQSPLKKEGQSHSKCDKWCVSVSELKEMEEASFSAERSSVMDFLCDPLNSLFEVNAFLNNKWQQQIGYIFSSIQFEFNEAIKRVSDICREKISSGSKNIGNICSSIRKLRESQEQESWTIKQERIYRDDLQKQLNDLYSVGILKLVNYEGVVRQVQAIKSQIKTLESNFWQKESIFSRTQRELCMKSKGELQDWIQNSTREEVNIKLHKIYSSLKLKIFKFEEHSDSVAIKCGLCSKKIIGKGPNKQIKRAECQEKLLNHFYQRHEEEVLEQCWKKGKTNYQLQFKELLQEVMRQGVRKFLIVDRENINSQTSIKDLESDVYKLEIVSKGRQNLASGKYLVAESQGKDAADILIIIVLYEIGRLVPESQITLLTKDHFGEILVKILEGIGRTVKSSAQYEGKEGSNQSQQMMMIDQQ